MRTLVLDIALFSFVLVASEAKIIQRCKLAQELKNVGMDGYLGYTLGDWLCIAFYESGLNTHPPMGMEKQKDYGIFRISNTLWCSDGVQPSKNICKISCHKLIDDDIKDDILCAKKILQHNGHLKSWPHWVKQCQGKDLSRYFKGCKLKSQTRNKKP